MIVGSLCLTSGLQPTPRGGAAEPNVSRHLKMDGMDDAKATP